MLHRQHSQLTGLLGAILLSSGLASSLALAEEAPSELPESTSPNPTPEAGSDTGAQPSDAGTDTKADEKPEMVEVRISLPDGRTIVRMEPAQATSARSTLSFLTSGHRTLPDGSRISVAARAVHGGSNSASLRSGGGSSGGGGGGGGSASSGGGGGSSGGVATTGRTLRTGGSSEGIVEGAATELVEGASTPTPEVKSSHGGVFQVTNNTSNYAVQGSGSSSGSNSSSSGGSSGGSGGDSGTPGTSQSGSTPSVPPQSVPTVGNPRIDDEGNASGGQRVEFHDAGMSAAVIGNMVYFIGAEFIQADESFTVVSGTPVGADAVVMNDSRPGNAGVDDLSSFNTGASTIRVEFPSDTTVDLVMQSQSADPSSPNRTQRAWTVRIR